MSAHSKSAQSKCMAHTEYVCWCLNVSPLLSSSSARLCTERVCVCVCACKTKARVASTSQNSNVTHTHSYHIYARILVASKNTKSSRELSCATSLVCMCMRMRVRIGVSVHFSRTIPLNTIYFVTRILVDRLSVRFSLFPNERSGVRLGLV